MNISNTAKCVIELDRQFFPQSWSLKNWESHFSKNTSGLTSYELDKKVIGFSCWDYNKWEKVHHLFKVMIVPNLRKQGHGKKLLVQTIADMRRSNSESAACFLEVESENSTALSMYQKIGFEVVGESKNFYGLNRHGLRMILSF